MSQNSKDTITELNIILFLFRNIKKILLINIPFFIIVFFCLFFIKLNNGPIYSLSLYLKSDSELIDLYNRGIAKASAFVSNSEIVGFSVDYRQELTTDLVFKSMLSSYFQNSVIFEFIEIETFEKYQSDYIKMIYENPNKFNNYELITFDEVTSLEDAKERFEKIIILINEKIYDYYLNQLGLFIYEVNNLIELSEYIEKQKLSEVYSGEYLTLELEFLKAFIKDFKDGERVFLGYNIDKIEMDYSNKGWFVRTFLIAIFLSLFLSFVLVLLTDFHKRFKSYLNES